MISSPAPAALVKGDNGLSLRFPRRLENCGDDVIVDLIAQSIRETTICQIAITSNRLIDRAKPPQYLYQIKLQGSGRRDRPLLSREQTRETLDFMY